MAKSSSSSSSSSSSVLSNCYTPLRQSSSNVLNSTFRDNGTGDKRTAETLRRLCLDTSVLSKAHGSALVELGHTKVLAKLMIETDGNVSQVEQGVLQVRVDYATHFGMAAQSEVLPLDGSSRRRQQQQPNNELEQQLHSALLPALNLKQYPKYVLNVSITILQDDGNLLAACCVSISLALSDARVELYDLVTCCQVVACPTDTDTDNQKHLLYADPTTDEERAATGSLVLALLPNWKEVTLWQQTGILSDRAMDLCRDGCKTLYKFMKQHLLQKEQERIEAAVGAVAAAS